MCGEMASEDVMNEIARLRTELEHAKAAAAGDHEGIRLWMLDCNQIAAKRLVRAEKAEETIAALRSVLLEGGQPDSTARRRALAILAEK